MAMLEFKYLVVIKKLLLIIGCVSYSWTFLSAPLHADDDFRGKLLLAYDNYRDNWLSAEIMIWCASDSKKFKLEKNAFGKETLYLLKDAKWTNIPNVKINGYQIHWTEKNIKIRARDILSNETDCRNKDTFTCKYPDHYGSAYRQFINIWKRNYHPSLKSSDFSKYFKITSTSDIENSIRIDRAWFYRSYDDNIRKISVEVSESVSQPPEGLRRRTVDEYQIRPLGAGACRLVK